RVRRLAELDPHGLQDRVGVVLDRREALLGEHLDGRELARDERHLLGYLVQPRGATRLSASPPASPGLFGHVVLLARLDRRLVRPAVASLRAGSSTGSPRRGNGSAACGIPIAPTKCSWTRGSVAVSILSTRRTTASISVRASRLRSAIRAPVPAAFPAL